jgi:DNA-binding GntR family transcriptional regulator
MNEYSIADRGVSLTDQVYRQLTEGFRSGWYSPGQRINIRSLAEAIGVSQTPVREAISRFISEGVLKLENRAIEVPLISSENFEELFDLRLNLEGRLAESAAAKIDDPSIDKLEQIQDAFEGWMEKKNYKEVLHTNVAFHFTIYRSAGLPLSVQLVERLWLLVGPTMNLAYPALDTAVTGIRRHRRIIDSVRSRNAAGLRAAVEADILAAKETMAKVLAADG